MQIVRNYLWRRLSVKKVDIIPRVDPDASGQVDESFAALNTRKKVRHVFKLVIELSSLSSNTEILVCYLPSIICLPFHNRKTKR